MVIAISLIVLLCATIGYWAFFKWGQTTVVAKQAEASAEKQHEQLEVFVNRPTKSELLNSLQQDGDF